MTVHVLHVEGVNLRHAIDDTEDLATRRGGSLMLLDAVNEVAVRFNQALVPISTGASSGLFTVQPSAAADIAEQVLDHLAGHPLYRHATHVCAAARGTSFQEAREAALAACRWQQMQALSFAPHGLAPSDLPVCILDEVRASADPGSRHSASVQARRKDGQTQKQAFYRRQLGDAGFEHLRFSYDFDDLAGELPGGIEPATLAGKIAVFYADGNQFGRFGRSCHTPDELQAWDRSVRAWRKALLAGIVDLASHSLHWQTPDGRIRLETLQWGGDEVTFVVPAWCGMALAQAFFRLFRGRVYPVRPPAPPDAPPQDQVLTHACGLVFCHRQAPISSITALAKNLAELGKASGHLRDSLHWMTLESFDQAGDDLAHHLRQRYPGHGSGLGWDGFGLDPAALDALVDHLPPLKRCLPRSAMVDIVRQMALGHAFDAGGQASAAMRRAYRQVGQACEGDARTSLAILWQAVHPLHGAWSDTEVSPSDLPAWVKLVELWDYCPETGLNQPGVQA